jgi:hypothetical protein
MPLPKPPCSIRLWRILSQRFSYPIGNARKIIRASTTYNQQEVPCASQKSKH